MDKLTANQTCHLIVADIAMAMAVATLERRRIDPPGGGYVPGALRDAWLDGGDHPDRRRVLALATAGMGSLQDMSGADLLAQAERFGVPIDAAQAEAVSRHFQARREAVLTYRR